MNFNPMDMMKNLQQFQGQMEEMQNKLKDLTVEASSGGNLVTVTINGKMELVDIRLDPIAVDPRDVTMLQELIKSACVGAYEKMQEQLKGQMGDMFPGGIPGLSL